MKHFCLLPLNQNVLNLPLQSILGQYIQTMKGLVQVKEIDSQEIGQVLGEIRLVVSMISDYHHRKKI